MKKYLLALLLAILTSFNANAEVYYYLLQGVDPTVGSPDKSAFVVIKDTNGDLWFCRTIKSDVKELQSHLLRDKDWYVKVFNNPLHYENNYLGSSALRYCESIYNNKWYGSNIYQFIKLRYSQTLTKCKVYNHVNVEFSFSLDMNTMIIESNTATPRYYKRYDASTFIIRRNADDLF